jgi:uncharacterized membrane protein
MGINPTLSLMLNHAWTPLILSHAMAATTAIVIGAAMLWRRKGDRPHRLLGRIWFVLMAFVAAGSFGIKTGSGYSWIHGLSLFTLAMLARGWWMARTGDIANHRRIMQGLYVGALLITGLFTLLPSRLIGHWLWVG